MIVYWNNFHGSLSHHWLNVRCLLLTEGWCYLRDLSSGASFLVWHCSALTGSRVWVPPTESETTNHHKDRNREAVSTEISPSSEIGVQGWHHIEKHLMTYRIPLLYLDLPLARASVLACLCIIYTAILSMTMLKRMTARVGPTKLQITEELVSSQQLS